MTTAIRDARRALGDSPTDPRWIPHVAPSHGLEKWYADFVTRVAKVERARSFTLPKT